MALGARLRSFWKKVSGSRKERVTQRSRGWKNDFEACGVHSDRLVHAMPKASALSP